VLPGAPRGSLTALLSPPQCRTALGTMPDTLAWVDHCPCEPPIDVALFHDGDTRRWFLEGLNIISTCSKLYVYSSDFIKETRSSFTRTEENTKEKFPDISYKNTNKRRRFIKVLIDRNAPDADDFSSIDKFILNSFIPVMDSLQINLQKRAVVYNNISQKL
jgi:hypothetical protein